MKPWIISIYQRAGAVNVTAILLCVAVMSGSAAMAQNYVKWNQPPDPVQPENLYYGWNEESTFWDLGPTVADDWVCNTADPIVGIRWWGSYLGWQLSADPPELPSHFHILFWTDVPADPADPDSFSHPGQVIHEVICYNFRQQFVGWDYDPRTGEYESCFQFEQDFTPSEWFYQNPAGEIGIYWVSISACYDLAPPPVHAWGWKTRPRDVQSPAPDDAVVIVDPTMPMPGSVYGQGYPLEFPEGVSWDMAFELLAQEESSGFKWQQPPLSNPDSQYPDCFWGWDEISDYHMYIGPIMADDWVCFDERPLTDIHWWGSYLNWMEPFPPEPPFGFHIGIWTDIPAGEDDWFSHPGMMIHEWWVPYEETMELPVGCDFHPDWMEGPETCFYYSFLVPDDQWFYQDPGPTVYWISIAADYAGMLPNNPWGWKTRPRDLSSPAPDDAVRIWAPSEPIPGMIYEQGEPLFWPDPESSWDLAFELSTTGQGETYVKWSQPPEPYVPDDAYNGWNEFSVYGRGQIAADDWVCVNADPISDVHWWGSFLGWGHREPPTLPVAFRIGIWTDVPAGEDQDFSHPGVMLWEYFCNDYRVDFAGWDFDPRSWDITSRGLFAPPETCYYFSCDLPQSVWFYQDPGEHIYWVSIAVIYDDQPCECNGDLDGDGAFTLADLAMLANCYGDPYPAGCEQADLDCDGDVDDADAAILQCQMEAGWPDPACCPASGLIEHPFGMKTRPRANESPAPDDAVVIWDPTAPVPGSAYGVGAPLWWPTPAESWDLAFRLTAAHVEESGMETKWVQPLECEEGFDAESNLWWPGENPWYPKWIQPPDVTQPGMHCDDQTMLADDWRCEGGLVTDLHWFGNYENYGIGLAGFDLAIYADTGGMPAGPPAPPLWSAYVTITETGEIDTGLVNSDGDRIYRYVYFLPEPFVQELGQIYWLTIRARPNAGGPLALWRWQEAGRNWPPILNPAMYYSAAAGWVPICWPDETCTDFAFIISSNEPVQEVNKVVADDFYSDGRDILDLRWWGSYFDERYLPDFNDEIHVLDGWLIGIHWADVNAVPQFPPDILLDPHPTVLAVYFAPAWAVSIVGLDCVDCNGHALYEYYVDLDNCCLVCTQPDPRNNYPPPGLPGVFQEVRNNRYWLSIQAVTGIEWLPDACAPTFTGHLPPLSAGGSGAFWGWHTGVEPADSPGPLNVAALGKIVDFTPYPPECWDYGMWIQQPWECPSEPRPVNMSFELWTEDCPENLHKDGLLVINLADLAELLSHYGSCVGATAYWPAADFNNDGCIGLSDLAQLLSVYGQSCPTW